MRMRKLPWAEAYLMEQDVVIKKPASYAGHWRTLLQCEQLHVEIGSGKGDYWTQMASLYPQYGWVGIEKNESVAALAVRKYAKLDIKKEHMRFIQDDAQDIQNWFAPQEINVLHLNFSDPWPKKRAHKKRLSSQAFIAQYAHILKDDGEIQMKTDNMDLFEYSILAFQKAGWFLHDVCVNYRRIEHPEDVITEYERRFMDRGQPIYRAVWKKQPLKEND